MTKQNEKKKLPKKKRKSSFIAQNFFHAHRFEVFC